MNPSLEQILREHKVKGVFHTHVTMGPLQGKYQFGRQDLEVFWKKFMNTLQESPKSCIGIAEKPQTYLPVLADIDIKIRDDDSQDIGDYLHTETHTTEVIQIYQKVLKKIVEECTDENLLCILLEKPLYRINKNGNCYAKHGFHLHFPNCFLSKVDQEVQLIPRVKDLLNKKETFKDIGVEDSGKLIDSSCCKVPWLLYGCSKGEGLKPYMVSKVYNSKLEPVKIEKALKYYQIFDDREKLIRVQGRVREYLPRILSILPYGRDTHELVHGLISPLKEKLREKKQIDKNYKKLSVTQGLAIAKKLLPLLADFRAEDRNEWMTIGWILFNIGEGCSDALDMWCDFSSRCQDQYDEGVCIHTWHRMVKKDITIASLKYYASIDSPEKYRQFKQEEATKYIHQSLSGSHNDIAKVLFAEYGTEFVCVSVASKMWFQFSGHTWEQIEDGVFLRQKISGNICKEYSKIGGELLKKLSDARDKGEEAMFQSRLKQIQKMMGNLKSAPYKNNVMKECMEVFYDRRFREKLDTNPTLFPFKNGIYDLVTNTFRRGRPEDFISKTAPINYIEFSEDDERVHSVYDYLEKVFPDKSIRQYFLDVSSDIFMGGNHQKHVYFWTGEGDNAKSVTQNIFEKMLGRQLSIKFDTTVITGKKVQSGSANPQLARAGGGVRLATLEEPNSDETINIGILKNLSGNDSYYARDLFEKGKDGREITPMFKLVFICNKLPKLKYSDKAVWSRIRVIPFESTFCRPNYPAPAIYEEQLREKRFPMDKEFGKKIPTLVEPFAWILLQHRKKMGERVEPEKVRMATAIYRKQNDVYRQFIEERIVEDKDKNLSLSDLYGAFKTWYHESMPHHTVPIKNEIEEYFERAWGFPVRKRWPGYRLRTLQDDLDEGNAVILDDNDLHDYSVEENKEGLINYDVDGKNLPPM
jgi:P4 family phage/plasmid primase-like protien